MTDKPAILLVTPPLVAPNTPYPATPHLTAFLRQHGWPARQEDLSLALLRTLFTRATLAELAETARARLRADPQMPPLVPQFLAQLSRYLAAVEPVVDFLGGRVGTLPPELPRGPRFRGLDELRAAGSPLAHAAARDERLHASLFLDDIADFVREGVDARFGFARYAERLARAAGDFGALAEALAGPPSPVDRRIDALAHAAARRHTPALVGITVPFPGNLYGALRIARAFRDALPQCRVLLGGGYVSTELRNLTDRRLFDAVDALVFDDGELPLLRYAESLVGGGGVGTTPRVATRDRLPAMALAAPDAGSAVVLHRERPAPVHDGLPLSAYFGLAESANPMHRLWSERFWNKLALAHGCYWHRCAFCDTSLDYIRRFDPADVGTILGWMEAMHAETGRPDFHFVDEAAPPALLRALAQRLAARGAPYRWWTNIRLDRAFDADLAQTLAAGGCIAVSAGLECATARLLTLMDKGFELRDAVCACAALARAGLRVHAYAMYGFPTMTVQETVDGLELVRQLFDAGWLHSAYWHRFALTCHSPAWARRAAWGLRTAGVSGGFARNEVPYREPDAPDHAALGEGLRAATYNFVHGVGLRDDVRRWFPCRVPRPTLPRDYANETAQSASGGPGT